MALAEYRHPDTPLHEWESGSVPSLAIDGPTYDTVNWSLGGCLIEGYKGELSGGSLINLTNIRLRDRVVQAHLEA